MAIWINEYGIALNVDATGHEHKGKGKGGGQFVKKSTSGSNADEPPPPIPKTSTTEKAAIVSINNNPTLSDEEKKEFSTAINKACSKMPPKAHELIGKNISKNGFCFYKSSFELINGLHNKMESNRSVWRKMADWWGHKVSDHFSGVGWHNPEYRKSLIPLVAACYLNQSGGSLHLSNADFASTREVVGKKEKYENSLTNLYAHELTHAIDGNQKFSGTPEWEKVWQEEIVDKKLLTDYGATLKVEGFAEMGRAVYGIGVDLKKVERTLPKCSKFFKDNGLWPV